jgi:ligand-binding SRPBCC domain-containing protein
MEIPSYFVDEMVEGKFKSFKHEHSFNERNGFVIMIDKIQYQTPYGFFGKLFDILFLKKHLTNFINERNSVLKELAENHQK